MALVCWWIQPNFQANLAWDIWEKYLWNIVKNIDFDVASMTETRINLII